MRPPKKESAPCRRRKKAAFAEGEKQDAALSKPEFYERLKKAIVSLQDAQGERESDSFIESNLSSTQGCKNLQETLAFLRMLSYLFVRSVKYAEARQRAAEARQRLSLYPIEATWWNCAADEWRQIKEFRLTLEEKWKDKIPSLPKKEKPDESP